MYKHDSDRGMCVCWVVFFKNEIYYLGSIVYGIFVSGNIFFCFKDKF